MKNRMGFVANSSSSSFVVIDYKSKLSIPKELSNMINFIIGEQGETEFGWQVEKYFDFWDKLNFAWLQAKEMNRKDYLDMIVEILEENIENCPKIQDNLTNDDYGIDSDKICGYIDHQSVGDGNIEIFDSKNSLERFLFLNTSYLQNDNDNY